MPWRMVRRGRSAANTQRPHGRSRHLPDEDTKLAMVTFVKAKSANLLTKIGEFADQNRRICFRDAYLRSVRSCRPSLSINTLRRQQHQPCGNAKADAVMMFCQGPDSALCPVGHVFRQVELVGLVEELPDGVDFEEGGSGVLSEVSAEVGYVLKLLEI